MNEALRDWVTQRRRHVLLHRHRSPGPHPYPSMVRDFQRVIGREARAQMLERDGRLPDAAVACVGGGSQRASACSHAFVDRRERAAVRRRGGGRRASRPGGTPRRSAPAASACCTACDSYVLATTTGRSREAHSISAGLDYPGVGPEHAWLKDRAAPTYVARHRRRGARRVRAPVRAPRASCRALESGARRSRTLRELAPAARRARSWSCVCRAAATRTCRRCSSVFDEVSRLKSCRLADVLARARKEKRAALIIYLCRGRSGRSTTTVAWCRPRAEAGADVIELGVPFSDPSADGPVIQRAIERALAPGARARTTCSTPCAACAPRGSRHAASCCSATTTRSSRGEARSWRAAAERRRRRAARRRPAAGGGVAELDVAAARAAGLAFIPLVAPTTSPERIERIAARASSFALLRLDHRRHRRRANLDVAARRAAEVRAQTGLAGGGRLRREDARSRARGREARRRRGRRRGGVQRDRGCQDAGRSGEERARVGALATRRLRALGSALLRLRRYLRQRNRRGMRDRFTQPVVADARQLACDVLRQLGYRQQLRRGLFFLHRIR